MAISNQVSLLDEATRVSRYVDQTCQAVKKRYKDFSDSPTDYVGSLRSQSAIDALRIREPEHKNKIQMAKALCKEVEKLCNLAARAKQNPDAGKGLQTEARGIYNAINGAFKGVFQVDAAKELKLDFCSTTELPPAPSASTTPGAVATPVTVATPEVARKVSLKFDALAGFDPAKLTEEDHARNLKLWFNGLVSALECIETVEAASKIANETNFEMLSTFGSADRAKAAHERAQLSEIKKGIYELCLREDREEREQNRFLQRVLAGE